MTDRVPLAQLTKSQLDALYDELARYEEVVGELNEFNTGLQRQATRAEAAITRVRAYVERLDHLAAITVSAPDRSLYQCIAHDLHDALDEPKEG